MSNVSVAQAFEQQRPAIITAITQAIFSRVQPDEPRVSQDELRGFVSNAMQLFSDDLTQGTTKGYASFWRVLGPDRAREDHFSIRALLGTILATEYVIVDHLAPYYAHDVSATRAMIQQVYRICNYGRMVLYQVFTEVREDVIRTQTIAIQELSVPIVPIYPGVLVLPLIGRIDTQRADAIMETLLNGVSREEACIVLLDITGVPLVDTATAHHLIQAARAVRLLGAEMVLVGIGPEIAQTVMQLGVDLSDITTCSNLQAGFALALRRLGLRIVAK